MTSQPTVKLPGYWGPALAVIAALGAGGYGGSYLTSHPGGGPDVQTELAKNNGRLDEMQRSLERIELELRSQRQQTERELRTQRQQIGDLREKVAGMDKE
ncbi:MAG: hypothetical protein AAGA68_27395 [Pseudomonadota bacterium]